MRSSRTHLWRRAALIAAGFTVLGLLLFSYRYLEILAAGQRRSFVPPLVDELTAAWSAALIVSGFLWLVPRYPISRATWRRRVPLWAGILVVSGVVHTLMMAASRPLAYRLVGLGTYDYGIMAWRFPMEFSMQAITLSSAIALVHFAYYTRTMRERELRAAQLEAQLGRAKLTSLQAQLHPHFLFNTLNAITSMMYEDPAAADRMMTRLSDLLRLTLAESAGLDAPIREEVEWLEHYLAIMRVRYGERLRVRIDVDPTVADVPVPRLILQPLVENAIRHGIAARPGPGTIEIVAVRHGECMRIEVRDDGPGVRDPGEAQRNGGIGLVNTRERLRHAYGDTHAFALTNRAGGGAVATIDVPVMGPRVSMHDGTAIGA